MFRNAVRKMEILKEDKIIYISDCIENQAMLNLKL